MFNLNDRMAGVLEDSFEELMRELQAIRRELEQINARLADADRPLRVRAVSNG